MIYIIYQQAKIHIYLRHLQSKRNKNLTPVQKIVIAGLVPPINTFLEFIYENSNIKCDFKAV